MSEKICRCGIDINTENDDIIFEFSLLGNGTFIRCKKCAGIIMQNIDSDDINIPAWIRKEIKGYWDRFDPQLF
jgi:hypothetical protein